MRRIRRPTVHWFLPDEPDVLGGLRTQMAITRHRHGGLRGLGSWQPRRRRAGPRDASTRLTRPSVAVRVALRDAFITPIGPEDIFILSQLLDKVLNASKDVVRESRGHGYAAGRTDRRDGPAPAEGTQHLSRAFDAIAVHGGKDDHHTATAAADDATKSARRMEKVYRQAMSGLLALDDEGSSEHEHVREVIGRRELYRRLSRIADAMVDVADRVWYAAVKEM